MIQPHAAAPTRRLTKRTPRMQPSSATDSLSNAQLSRRAGWRDFMPRGTWMPARSAAAGGALRVDLLPSAGLSTVHPRLQEPREERECPDHDGPGGGEDQVSQFLRTPGQQQYAGPGET